MTISECLKDWLGKFPGFSSDTILTDRIEAPDGMSALYKSPNKSVVPLNDGSKRVTEYYQFFFRGATIEESQRISNNQLVEDLENWVEEKEFEEDYPDLSQAGKYICEEIALSGYGSVSFQEEDNAVYQITIEIKYLKERS
ncbi:MAG: hypothetical protein NC307_13225 [Roseburia sp.]|nr:hypothetical protein [Roseburia sp.]